MQREMKKTAAEYLDQMAGFAGRLHEAGLDHAGWAADKRYVRINGGGLRVVSLCADSPCGKVEGHGVCKTTRRLDKARYAPIPPGEPKSKPEHLWQAALIEHALRWPDALPEVLHLRDACDELRFVTDELSLTDEIRNSTIRADVVLLGRRGATWFPVFVELKVQRSMKRLLEQLDANAGLSNLDDTTRAAFKKFVAAAAHTYDSKKSPRQDAIHNIAGEIDLDHALKVMIWPSTTGVSTHLERARQKGVRVLEFSEGVQPAKRFEASSLSLKSAIAT